MIRIPARHNFPNNSRSAKELHFLWQPASIFSLYTQCPQTLQNKCQININIKMPALFIKKIKSDKITAFSFLRQCICLSDRIVRIFFAVFRRTAKNLSDMHDLYLTWTLESIQGFDLMLYKKEYQIFITLTKLSTEMTITRHIFK